MTIVEIEKTLPNGFHDASLEKLNIDYKKQEVRMEILVNVGNHELPSEEKNESNRKGILTLSGLQFFVIEPPDSRYPYQRAKSLWIAGSGTVESAKLSSKLPEPLTEGTFMHGFFVNDWNSFIIVAATDAHFDWC